MRAILHIGSNKTGTTALQKTFATNVEELRRQGILYPVAGRGDTIRQFGIRAAFTPLETELSGYARRVANNEGRKNYSKAFIKEFDKELSQFSGDSVILSDEALFIYASPGLFGAISKFLQERFTEVQVVCYLRRPDEYLKSEYSQHIKVGGRQTVLERIEQMTSAALYEDKLHYVRDFLDGSPVIRWYDNSQLKNGSIIDDFSDACGIDFPDLVTPGIKNRSLSADGIKTLRAINKHFGNRRPEVLRRLTESYLCDGPKFQLRLKARKKIYEAVKDEHQRIIDAFFDGDKSQLYRIEDMLEPNQKEPPDPDIHKRVAKMLITLHNQLNGEDLSELNTQTDGPQDSAL